MVTRELKVFNRAGIHARPAASIVKLANKYESELYLEKENMKINGKSIMGIITLGATHQSTIVMTCDGPDEQQMADAIQSLFENRFEE
ncbi:MAG: HPr family phosphocarrier protein [Sphaerochaeta sp.]|jgi:phosphocarrier protein|uniref:HPr family phosphocarrier protein n=2 Tax=root TaxID=1 RepID=A0ABY4DJL9_9SPIR|nr:MULTISPECIES: HPr family phosphocarrier protein [Sphaerochaeta]NLA97887.1 HPr family phosphocarrier protein [Spirochaetales bacterium]MDD2394775.1 HPr family phosphocarrier protein [Sphaerochaeta sp.]MDD4037162.1 HPr family phosphocarrier protein [Sphaerochaeta sp.]MDD4450948.1 HPr family phosphocarrier protein [Sphaerochaeta sp.]MDX9984432.1 HPr family phosphocarrier protein [Sphaerochaeta sp.]